MASRYLLFISLLLLSVSQASLDPAAQITPSANPVLARKETHHHKKHSSSSSSTFDSTVSFNSTATTNTTSHEHTHHDHTHTKTDHHILTTDHGHHTGKTTSYHHHHDHTDTSTASSSKKKEHSTTEKHKTTVTPTHHGLHGTSHASKHHSIHGTGHTSKHHTIHGTGQTSKHHTLHGTGETSKHHTLHGTGYTSKHHSSHSTESSKHHESTPTVTSHHTHHTTHTSSKHHTSTLSHSHTSHNGTVGVVGGHSHTSKHSSKHSSEHTTKHTSTHTSDHTSKHTTEHSSKHTTDHTSKHTTDHHSTDHNSNHHTTAKGPITTFTGYPPHVTVQTDSKVKSDGTSSSSNGVIFPILGGSHCWFCPPGFGIVLPHLDFGVYPPAVINPPGGGPPLTLPELTIGSNEEPTYSKSDDSKPTSDKKTTDKTTDKKTTTHESSSTCTGKTAVDCTTTLSYDVVAQTVSGKHVSVTTTATHTITKCHTVHGCTASAFTKTTATTNTTVPEGCTFALASAFSLATPTTMKCLSACVKPSKPGPAVPAYTTSPPDPDPEYRKRAIAGRVMFQKRASSSNIRQIGNCALATPAADPVYLPGWPAINDMLMDDKNGNLAPSLQVISRYDAATTIAAAAGCEYTMTTTRLNAKQFYQIAQGAFQDVSQQHVPTNNDASLDHAYEKQWLKSFLEAMIGPRISCANANLFFFPTLNGGCKYNIMQQVWDSLASDTNLDFIAMSQYLNAGAKGKFFTGGFTQPFVTGTDWIPDPSWVFASRNNANGQPYSVVDAFWTQMNTYEWVLYGLLEMSAEMRALIDKTNNRIYKALDAVDNQLRAQSGTGKTFPTANPWTAAFPNGIAAEYKTWMDANILPQINAPPIYMLSLDTHIYNFLAAVQQHGLATTPAEQAEFQSMTNFWATQATHQRGGNMLGAPTWHYSFAFSWDLTAPTKRDTENSSNTNDDVMDIFARGNGQCGGYTMTGNQGGSQTTGTATDKHTSKPTGTDKPPKTTTADTKKPTSTSAQKPASTNTSPSKKATTSPPPAKPTTTTKKTPPTHTAPPPAADTCGCWYDVLFDHFEVWGKNFDAAKFGSDGSGLKDQIGGCGDLTEWSFSYLTDNAQGWQWSAHGNLPIGTKACVGRAVVSAGGDDPSGCTGAG